MLFITVLVISCRKVPNKPAGDNPGGTTDSTATPDTTKFYHIDLTTKVISSVAGFVSSHNMGPSILEGVLVTYGDKTTFTDKYGYFEIKNASVIKQAAQLTISKKDYITNYRTFIAEEGQSFFIKMNLDFQPGGVYTPGSVGTWEDGLGTVTSMPGVLINESTNAIYTGFARPYLSTIILGDENMSEKMPGSERGLDSLGYPKFLTSIAVVTLGMHGMNGENLQMPAGNTINLSFRYFGEGLPATVDAWHYDTKTGLWRKEGIAVKSDYAYNCRIDKLGSWNFALSSDCVQFKARLLTSTGEPLPFVYVNARPALPAFIRTMRAWLYTDVNGYVSGLAPAGSSFSLDVFGDQCNTPVYSKTLTASSPVVDAGDINIESPNIVSVSAKVTACNGEGITNGFVMVTSPGNGFRLDASNNGLIHFNAVVCDFNQLKTYIFIAEDRAAMQVSDHLYADLVPGNNDIGNLSTCGIYDGSVQVSGKLVDNASNPLPEMYVKIAPANNLLNAFQAESNSAGIISTPVYTNTDYTLSVYGAKDCNSPLLTRHFSTINKDMDIGNLTITGITTATVTGTVVDCNNNTVTSGYIVMQRYTKSHTYKLNEAGGFNFSMRLCDATSAEAITLVAQDLGNIQTSLPVSVTLSAGSNNAGNIKACFDSSSDLQFVNYTVDDTLYQSYVAPNNSITQSIDPPGGYMFINAANPVYGGAVGISISNGGIAKGSSQWLDGFTSPEFSWSVVQPVYVAITEYGAIGGYVAGHFSGQVQQSVQNQVPRKVTCSFRVKRIQ